MSKKYNEQEKQNYPDSPNPKVVTEDDRDNISDKDRKSMLAEDKKDAKERGKPKEYSIKTFKKQLNKDQEKEFNELDDDEQRKFIIRKWNEENRYLDTKDMHEVSLDDQRFAGIIPTQEA